MQGHLSDAENLRPCLGSRQNATMGPVRGAFCAVRASSSQQLCCKDEVVGV